MLMGELKTLIRGNLRQYGMIMILVIITGFFQITTGGVLLLPQNVFNLVQQNAFVVVLSVGMMICILTGGNIDLSVGSMVAFVGAVAGALMIGQGMSVPLAIAICLGAGLLAGAWHGFWISRYAIPSFIATLSGMLIFRGLTFTVLRGRTYFSYPESFLALSTGYLTDYLGANTGFNFNLTTVVLGVVFSAVFVVMELVKRGKRNKHGIAQLSMPFFLSKLVLISAVIILFMYQVAVFRGMPIVLIPVGIIVVVYSYIMNNTVAGRYVYAVGGNQKAAHLSGINVRKVMFFTYVNVAFLSALAGLIFTARLNSASPMAGQGFELDAIAACFIGGASARGGVGTIGGAVIGALIMGLLNNGMSILGVSADMQMAIKGLVLLLAVFMDLAQKNKTKA